MSKRSERKLDARQPPPAEAVEAGLEAVAALRVVVLRLAVSYGVFASLSDGGTDAGEWLAWLRWITGLLATVAYRTGSSTEMSELPEWLQELIDALEVRADVGPRDLFEEPEFRQWSREAFEALAAQARPIEQLGLEPLGEFGDQPQPAGPRLLGLLQDALVLVSCDDREAGQRRVGAAEMLEHLNAARAGGTWEPLTR